MGRGTGENIHIRQEVDESGEHELALFQKAVDSSGHAVYITDIDGTIEYVNPAFEEITGYATAEALGETPAILTSGEQEPGYYERLWETILKGDVWEEELINERKSGEQYVAHQTIAPVERNSEITHFVAIQSDATGRKRRERRLRSFKQAVEHAGHLVVITDSTGEIEYVNPAFEETTGYSREEAIGATPRLLKSGEHEQEFYEGLWETILSGNIWEGELINRRKNGERFVVEQAIAPILDKNGGVEQFVGVSKEITGRKETEQALRRREERFRTIFERHSAPMLLIDPETGAIERANEAAVDFYGYDREEFTSLNIQEINTLSPEEVARERERAEAADKNRFVFEHKLASSEVRPVEVHSSPIELGDDSVLFSIIHDITDRVEYERELKRHKELVENIPVGIYRNTSGDHGEFVEVNPAMVEMFAAESADELLECSVSELYVDQSERQSFSETLREMGIVTKSELELQTLSGERFWGSVTAIATERDGETYFDGIIQDITVRKKYERRLEEQRDNLEVLNQIVRHDIRNDLQVVLAGVELLEEHVDEDGLSSLEMAMDGARNAVELTNTARDMAEVMLRTEADHEAIALRRTLKRQIDELESEHPAAEVEIDGTIPHVAVQANELLDSVFRNLLKNAVQHNDKSVPEITVFGETTDDAVVVRIADNGPGIRDTQKDQIFGKGEKGLNSEGTGIGLYLVHTLVESYGGDVWVEDNDPEGSVFYVELPQSNTEPGQ